MNEKAAVKAMKITLTQGQYAIVDEDDYWHLILWDWHYAKCRNTGYAKRTSLRADGNRPIRMHRVIMQAKPGEIVDHINGNGLDNRKCNLRLVSHAENCQNRVRVRTDSTTGVNGVYRKAPNTWRVHIARYGKRVWIGTYHSLAEAKKARQQAEAEYAKA